MKGRPLPIRKEVDPDPKKCPSVVSPYIEQTCALLFWQHSFFLADGQRKQCDYFISCLFKKFKIYFLPPLWFWEWRGEGGEVHTLSVSASLLVLEVTHSPDARYPNSSATKVGRCWGSRPRQALCRVSFPWALGCCSSLNSHPLIKHLNERPECCDLEGRILDLYDLILVWKTTAVPGQIGPVLGCVRCTCKAQGLIPHSLWNTSRGSSGPP